MASIRSMAQGIKARFNSWREKRAVKRQREEQAKALTRFEAARLAQHFGRRAVELRGAQKRQALMDAARAAFLADDRVRALAGGVLWWPALAPLKPDERTAVRHALGLQTRPLTAEVEARREQLGQELDAQVRARREAAGVA